MVEAGLVKLVRKISSDGRSRLSQTCAKNILTNMKRHSNIKFDQILQDEVIKYKEHITSNFIIWLVYQKGLV